MPKPKVILAITKMTGGGAERVVSVWASELAEMGFEVYLLLAGRTDNEYPLSDAVHVLTVAPRYMDYQKLSGYKKYSLRRKLIKNARPDYIISFLSQNRIWTLLCAWGTHAKRIETMRISPWQASGQNGLIGILTKLSFKKCYRLILQSKDQAPYFSDQLRKKAVVVPNPISEIYQTHFKREFPDNVQTIIAAGRLSEQKNYILMVDAYALVSEKLTDSILPVLKIFGAEESPGYREKLKKYIKEKGLEDKILLMGRSSHIEEEYSKADIFLMSSNFEGMPNALAEAMASRLVCISTDCKTGPRDLICSGENGFLVPTNDCQAMANAIICAIKMPKEERIEFGDQARQHIMTYCSKENSIAKLIAILK